MSRCTALLALIVLAACADEAPRQDSAAAPEAAGLPMAFAPPPPGGGGGGGGCGGVIETLTCSSEYVNQLQSGSSGIDGPYSCGSPYPNLTQPENEHVYEFTCQVDGDV